MLQFIVVLFLMLMDLLKFILQIILLIIYCCLIMLVGSSIVLIIPIIGVYLFGATDTTFISALFLLNIILVVVCIVPILNFIEWVLDSIKESYERNKRIVKKVANKNKVVE